jgi:Fe2+ transport system protein B
VMELGLPVLVALNMVDVAEARGVPHQARGVEPKNGREVCPHRGHAGQGVWWNCGRRWARNFRSGRTALDDAPQLATAVGQIAAAWRDALPADVAAEGRALELLAGSNEGPEEPASWPRPGGSGSGSRRTTGRRRWCKPAMPI